MNLKEIAKKANVSVSTASKAFSGAKDISEQTRNIVLEVAKQDGSISKYMNENSSKHLIAVVCPEIKSEFYAATVEMLQSIIQQNNAEAIIGIDNFDINRQAELINFFVSCTGVDGIIVFCLNDYKNGYELPIVSIGKTNANVDSVDCDLLSPTIESLSVLKELGHSKIGFIGERLTSEKYENFIKAMNTCSLTVDESLTVIDDMRFEYAGYMGVDTLIKSGKKFTAIFCAYDYIAIGAIKRLKEAGLSVPEDVSVIGMDGITVGNYLSQKLTTVYTPNDEMLHSAVDLLLRKINNRYYRARSSTVIKGKLIMRDTVAKAK